jgi:hypothetical protein
MADSNEPKKETARIAILPGRQPLIDLPAMETPATAVTMTSEPRLRIDQIPMPLCWTLLAVSVTTLILQIWNYLA